MAIRPPDLPDEPAATPNPLGRVVGWFNAKKALNRFAVKTLESADVVLGSIPIAQVAAEVKDVILIALKD